MIQQQREAPVDAGLVRTFQGWQAHGRLDMVTVELAGC